MSSGQTLAGWAHEQAARETRMGEGATTAEAQDWHRDQVLNLTAIGCALEAIPPLKQDRDTLLAAIEEHRAELAHGITANSRLADDKLHRVADEVGGQSNG